MATEIGALRALLSLDSAQFESGIGRAQAKLGGFAAKMQGLSARMAKVGAAMSDVGRGVGLAIKRQLDAADELSKAAQKFGVPIEALSRLKYAADLSDLSLEGLGTGLRKLSQNMADAAAGNKTAIEMFEGIGVAVSNADGSLRPTEEVLQDIADVLARMPDGAAKTALAMKVFGKSGAEMIPLLNGGKTALQQMTAEAESLGIVISAKVGKAAENFNDNLTRLKTAVGGLGVQMAAALAPALETVSGWLVEATKAFRDLSPWTQTLMAGIAAVTVVAGPLVIGLGLVVGVIGTLFSPLGLLIVGLAGVAGVAAYVVTQWDDLKDRFPILDKIAGFGQRIKEQWDKLPAIKWAVLIPALSWATLIPGLRWAAFIPNIAWAVIGGVLNWGILISRLAWGALGFIGPIGWAALAGGLVWATLVDHIEWNGWIPTIIWADWIPTVNWSDFIPAIDWGAIFNKGGREAAAAQAQQLGGLMGAGVALGIRGSQSESEAAVRDFLGGLEGAARDETETHSPSQVWMRFGQDLMGGLALGIGDQQPVVERAMQNVSDSLSAIGNGLADYADSARNIGADIGNSLVGAFQSAETAIGNFVRTGKLDFSDLITSMIADLAKLAARKFILGPIASVLSGALGNVGGIVAGVLHAGGMVGGAGPGRMVPAMAFAGAPRMHGGGFAGLKPDEVPAILQRGEMVVPRGQASRYGQTQSGATNVNVTIMARDAESFRQSRTQVAADIARAVSLGRRGM